MQSPLRLLRCPVDVNRERQLEILNLRSAWFQSVVRSQKVRLGAIALTGVGVSRATLPPVTGLLLKFDVLVDQLLAPAKDRHVHHPIHHRPDDVIERVAGLLDLEVLRRVVQSRNLEPVLV